MTSHDLLAGLIVLAMRDRATTGKSPGEGLNRERVYDATRRLDRAEVLRQLQTLRRKKRTRR